MNPAAIKTIAKHAWRLAPTRSPSFEEALAAFLMAWVAWEALRHRLLREIAHDQGWSVKDAQKALGNLRISSMAQTNEALRKLNAKDAGTWAKRPAAIWKVLRGVEAIRNRVAHGARTVTPARLNAATAFVLMAVEEGLNAEGWLSGVSADGVPRKGRLGARRKRHPRSKARALAALEALLNVEVPRRTGAKAEMPTAAALNAATHAWFG